MAGMAASLIFAGTDTSGDVVRMVVTVVEILCGEAWNKKRCDQMLSWTRSTELRGVGQDIVKMEDLDAAVALTKFFMLGWSDELNYQLYCHFPAELLFG